jgi:hypothetical protein
MRPGGGRMAADMNPLEQQLLREATGGEEPGLCLRTETRVDAGGWLRRAPMWLCATGTRLVLLAVDRRRYAQGVELTQCRDSCYCHATGELLIRPAEGIEFDRVKMSAADAAKVLEWIGGAS